jgi:prepilin-type N-terminal cleavage/methylation domain-containing protein
MERRPQTKPRGFTLIELLVVFAIIAVLCSLLVPAFQRVNCEAKFAVCASHERQLVVAAQAYANDNNDKFPSQPLSSGQDAWDFSLQYYTIMTAQYGLKHSLFFCPDDTVDLQDSGYKDFGSFYLLGYSMWVPRMISGQAVPPAPGEPGFVLPQGTVSIQGPSSRSDPNVVNPMFSDSVITNPNDNPYVDLSVNGASMSDASLFSWTPHRWDGTLKGINEAWADGHVERVAGDCVKVRFKGAYWNFR